MDNQTLNNSLLSQDLHLNPPPYYEDEDVQRCQNDGCGVPLKAGNFDFCEACWLEQEHIGD